MKKIFLTLVLLLSAVVGAAAQELKFKSFELNVMDAAAKTHEVKDLNGDPCALLRVFVAVENADFKGNLGIVGEVREIRKSEYVMYIPAGSKSISIHGDGILPFTYHFNQKIEGLRTYELYLLLPESGPVKQALESQFLALTVSPATATVLVDNMVRTLEGGQLFLELPFGRHTYQVVAPMYHTQSGEFEISGRGRTDLKVALAPAFGTLNVSSTPTGATVMVDGVVKGSAPCSLQLESGEHFVQVMHEGYISYAQNVTITDGKSLSLPATLKANFSQVRLKAPHAHSEIWLGGKLLGRGTWSGRLNAGTYSVEIRTEGYETATQNIEVEADTPRTYTLTGSHAIYGVLKVTSSPMGATVKLDGKVLGTTPYMSNEVLVGNRTLELEMKGYNPYKKEIAIQKGKICEVVAVLSNEPVYKVGDLYRRGNKVGVIFEVDATGKKGKILDLGFFSPYDDYGSSRALDIINETYGKDWRLPTINELKTIYNNKSSLSHVVPLLFSSGPDWLSSYRANLYWHLLSLKTGKISKHYGKTGIGRICMVTSFDITKDAIVGTPEKTYKVGDIYDENGIRGIVFECDPDNRVIKIVAPYSPNGSRRYIDVENGYNLDYSEIEKIGPVNPIWRHPTATEMEKIAKGVGEGYSYGTWLLEGYRYNQKEAHERRLRFVATIASNPYVDEEASTPGNTVYKTTSGPYKVGDFYNEGGLFGVVFKANSRGDKVWIVGMNRRHNPGLGLAPTSAQREELGKVLPKINKTLELFEGEGAEPMMEMNLGKYFVSRNFEYDYQLGDYYNENGLEGVVIATNEWGDQGLLVSMKQAGPMAWYTGSKIPKIKGGSTIEEKIRSIKGWQTKFPLYDFATKLPAGWFVPGEEHKEEAERFAEVLNWGLKQINKTLLLHGGDPLAVDRGYWQLDAYLSEYSKTDDVHAIALRCFNRNEMFAVNQSLLPNDLLYVRPLAKIPSLKPTRKRTGGYPDLPKLK